MSARFGIMLPAVMCSVSLPLVIWDIHNERVIESMGMAWDTGAPAWPYQASDILLRLLNGPAYFIAQPIANVLRLGGPSHFVLVFPTILIWWWFVGSRLDHGWTGAKSNWRWPFFALLAVSAVLLLWAVIVISSDTLHWWLKYGVSFKTVQGSLLIVRFLTPAVWCAALSFLLILYSKRVVSR
jgi:hypothetical protein